MVELLFEIIQIHNIFYYCKKDTRCDTWLTVAILSLIQKRMQEPNRMVGTSVDFQLVMIVELYRYIFIFQRWLCRHKIHRICLNKRHFPFIFQENIAEVSSPHTHTESTKQKDSQRPNNVLL